MISNSKISNIVSSQLPFFVRNDHENFVAFLEAYYEFLEQETGVGNISRTLLEQSDIDLSDIFVQKFYDNFLPFIPKDTSVDKTLILKNIKDFYRSRGTEKSIRFLMRILFNEEVSFYYPQRDVLIASDGKWFVEKSIKVADVIIDGTANNDISAIDKFVGLKIFGQQTNASAIVETTNTYYEGGSLVKELKISNQVGEFISGEGVVASYFESGAQKTISANLFSGSINTVDLVSRGSGYKIGDTVTVTSNTGNGAVIIVSSISSGNLTSIVAFDGGAGFQSGSPILVSGGGGSGANAAVESVSANSYFHSNTYNVAWSTISHEANTRIGNTRYANLNVSITDPANNWIQNLLSFFTYANTGPISTVILYSPGRDYTGTPSITSEANNRVRNLGVLGKMRILNGGEGYVVGDVLTFNNVWGGYGSGANAIVTAIDPSGNGSITKVNFVTVPGHIQGGSGYDQFFLPKINVISNNTEAVGANIIITAVLGSGENLVSVGSTAGAIQELKILSRGVGYEEVPILSLSTAGDGSAQAVATIITGAYTYPGRYINDDGHLSAYNFIQDRDYYQKFSYVVKLRQSIQKYRQALKELIHPAGMKLFGEYQFIDEGETLKLPTIDLTDQTGIILLKTYEHDTVNGNLIINYLDHPFSVNDTVYLEWSTGNVAGNTISGPFKVRLIRDDNAIIIYNNTYLANTTLPYTTGNVYVGNII